MLVRHGRTGWNAEGRWQGHLDAELDEVGRSQAEAAARLLAGLRPDVLVSSDLRRAAATAAPLARLTGLALTTDPALRETFIGEWQGLSGEEVAEKYPQELAVWRSGDVTMRPGGGENRLEVSQRVSGAIVRHLSDVPANGLLVVVTHGGAARVAIGQLLGLAHESWGAIGGLSNCCWSLLAEAERGWRLLEHNAGSLPEPVLTEEG